MNIKKFFKNIFFFFLSYKFLNNLPDMVLYVDYNGIIRNANKKAKNTLGILENVTINEVFNDGFKAVRQSAKTKKSVLLEAKIPNEYFEISASKAGNNYCVCIRDNTEIIKRDIEKRNIAKFNNEKNAFIVKTANEVKALLNSITGFSKGLVDGIGGEITQKQSKYLNIINTNANDLSVYIDKFVDYSYAESLVYEPDYKNADVVIEIKEILKDYQKNVSNNKINIEFLYDDIESRDIYNDFNAVKKSIINIIETCISNEKTENIQMALTNPDTETYITHNLDDQKKYIQIKIKDNNFHITQEEIKFIFNPYAQTDNGRKNIVRSLRLGLVSILTKRANGFFNISVDNGTMFDIIIPAEKDEDE